MLPDTIEQLYFKTHESDKPEILCKLIDAADDFYGLVFCQTKALVTDLTQYLKCRGYRVDCLHGDMEQDARERTMKGFRDRRVKLLICTDVASRGLDVKDITHVINYSLPRELDNYVHRIGRTARSGKTGVAMSLVTPSHRGLITRIERMTKSRMLEGRIPTRRELGAKKVTGALARFLDQPLHTRAIEVMDESWKQTLSAMSAEEVAARFLTLMHPEVFGDREPANSQPARVSPVAPLVAPVAVTPMIVAVTPVAPVAVSVKPVVVEVAASVAAVAAPVVAETALADMYVPAEASAPAPVVQRQVEEEQVEEEDDELLSEVTLFSVAAPVAPASKVAKSASEPVKAESKPAAKERKTFIKRKAVTEEQAPVVERKTFIKRKAVTEEQAPAAAERKPYGDRKSFGERKPYGDRKPFGERKSYGDRKPFGEGKSFGERKPYGERDFGGGAVKKKVWVRKPFAASKRDDSFGKSDGDVGLGRAPQEKPWAAKKFGKKKEGFAAGASKSGWSKTKPAWSKDKPAWSKDKPHRFKRPSGSV